MKFSTPVKTFCCLSMSALMSNIPNVAAAAAIESTAPKMISTSAVVAEMDRAQVEQRMQDLINRADVQQALIERGVSPNEVSHRLAALSEQELRQLSTQVEEARAGGSILVEILIVVLIIFLIKRM
jgi:hypothetical protein